MTQELSELICRVHYLTETQDLLLSYARRRDERVPVPAEQSVYDSLRKIEEALGELSIQIGGKIVEREQARSRENRARRPK